MKMSRTIVVLVAGLLAISSSFAADSSVPAWKSQIDIGPAWKADVKPVGKAPFTAPRDQQLKTQGVNTPVGTAAERDARAAQAKQAEASHDAERKKYDDDQQEQH